MLKGRAVWSSVSWPLLTPASANPTIPATPRRLGSVTSARITGAERVSGLLILASSSVGKNKSPFCAKKELPPSWFTDLNRLLSATSLSASSARARVANSGVGASTTARM
jgi:hypothetical protein